MNLFFLVSFFFLAGGLAAVLLAFAIWKDLSVHCKTIHRCLVRRIQPLADAARLNQAALKLNHATLRFDSGDWPNTGRI